MEKNWGQEVKFLVKPEFNHMVENQLLKVGLWPLHAHHNTHSKQTNVRAEVGWERGTHL